MDNISYSYICNQLRHVADGVTDIANNNGYDFSDNATEGVAFSKGNTDTYEYTYDNNGNMIADDNKGITVTYNYHNLPTIVDFGSGNKIHWYYDAGGSKLRKVLYTGGTQTSQKDYASGFIYVDESIENSTNLIGNKLLKAHVKLIIDKSDSLYKHDSDICKCCFRGMMRLIKEYAKFEETVEF